MSRALVIGGLGFIGGHLVDALVERGDEVAIFDRALTPAVRNVPVWWYDASRSPDSLDRLCEAARGVDIIYHLAANPDARDGLTKPFTDLMDGTVATQNVLEAARLTKVPEVVFASSGTVYGERPGHCTERDLGCLPISLYGASKLAGEALVSAYAECFGIKGRILRFGNVVGSRATHGAIFDFHKKLLNNPEVLEVFGNGLQRKPYLHVSDCVAGMLLASKASTEMLEVFNMAPETTTSVERIALGCAERTGAEVRYTSSKPKGWPGDVSCSQMSSAKFYERGYRLRYTSDEAVDKAIGEVFDG